MPRTTSSRRRSRNRSTGLPEGVLPPNAELSKLLARELHDSVSQTLSSMLLDLERFRLDQQGRESAQRQIDELERSTRKALAELRALLVQLRAQQGAGEDDLVRLIRHGMMERKGRAKGVEFLLEVKPNWPERMSAPVATELFRIVAEAMDNAIRHSGARTIRVSLGIAEGPLATITVTDDGSGISVARAPRNRPRLGILGMSERAELLGGQVALTDGPSGEGTAVRIALPATVMNPTKPSP